MKRRIVLRNSVRQRTNNLVRLTGFTSFNGDLFAAKDFDAEEFTTLGSNEV